MNRRPCLCAPIFAGIVAAALISAPAIAQEAGSRETRDFVQATAQSDQFEIDEATSALAESKDLQVRAFAQQMLKAHQQTSADLKAAVAKAGLEQPKPGIGGEQSMFLGSLQSQRGEDFDKTYWRQQMLAHHAALATAQIYAASGDDPSIKAAASAIIPIISKHLAMAEQMYAKSDR